MMMMMKTYLDRVIRSRIWNEVSKLQMNLSISTFFPLIENVHTSLTLVLRRKGRLNQCVRRETSSNCSRTNTSDDLEVQTKQEEWVSRSVLKKNVLCCSLDWCSDRGFSNDPTVFLSLFDVINTNKWCVICALACSLAEQQSNALFSVIVVVTLSSCFHSSSHSLSMHINKEKSQHQED